MRKAVFICAVFLIAISFAMKPAAPVESPSNVDSTATKTLILLRHAKSDKSNMSIPDISRPLEASGREEAKEMGAYIAEQKLNIDAIVSSPSVRTKQTLEIICPLIGFPYEKVIWDSTLYACSGEHLISSVNSTDNKYKTVMYVGHNPSMTTAANSFQADSAISEVKTCGVVAIDFSVSDWAKANKENGILRFYQKPK